MKFSSVVFLAAGAFASVLPRDVPGSTTDINNIISVVGSLDTAIKAFSGPNDVDSLTSASQAVVSSINKANSDAGSIPDASITTSTPGFNDFLNAISNLVTAVKTVTGDLTSKRSDFAGFGLCPEVLTQIQAQQKAASTLQATLISKITTGLQSTAQTFAEQITQALGAAATSYQNCPASTVSPSSSVPTSTGTTSVPTSSGSSAPGVSTSCSESTSTPPAYTSTTSCSETTSTPPAYTSTTSCPESLSTPPSTPPPYVSTPPPYVSSPSTPTGTAPWTPIITPSTNGTVPPPTTPTIIPPTNAGAKHVAGFGSLVMAVAAAAVAAF